MLFVTINNQDRYEIISFTHTILKNEQGEFESNLDCQLDLTVDFDTVVQDVKTNFEGYVKISDDDDFLSYEFTGYDFENIRLFVDSANDQEKSIMFRKTL